MATPASNRPDTWLRPKENNIPSDTLGASAVRFGEPKLSTKASLKSCQGTQNALHGLPHKHPKAPKCATKPHQGTKAPAGCASCKPLQGQRLHQNRCRCHCHPHYHCRHRTRCPHLPSQTKVRLSLQGGGGAPSESSPTNPSPNNPCHSPTVGINNSPRKHQQS